jgi:selenide,water dikinase
MQANLEKRKRVMARSMRLGHCVCNPRVPCPCPLFRERNVCTCAGESLPPAADGAAVRLTDYVRSAGCAGKISQKDLHRVLAAVPVMRDPRVLVGVATADDAGVFQLTPDTVVVQTVDVFTPNVDDAFTFGRIAACNSLSDVYAMGGRPVTALSVIGFPIHKLPHAVMAEILKGAVSVLEEAGTVLLGGHSLDDEEIKFGLAVTGLVAKDRVVTNAGAEAGDLLVLTKPLGTGIVSLAAQLGRASPAALAAAVASMTGLNRAAAEAMVKHGAHACTDVTGFGLLGHLYQVVQESGAGAEIWCDRLPLLPEVLAYAREGAFSGANERNAEYCEAAVRFDGDVPEELRAVLYDPQTSGGLLIALPASEAGRLVGTLCTAGVAHATVVGRVIESAEPVIRILPQAPQEEISRGGAEHAEEEVEVSKEDKPAEESCCGHDEAATGKPLEMFRGLLAAGLRPGAVDAVTKELIAVALSLAVHCEACARIHIKKAKSMGISKAEIEECAALAAGFGGCRTLMLWQELESEVRT